MTPAPTPPVVARVLADPGAASAVCLLRRTITDRGRAGIAAARMILVLHLEGTGLDAHAARATAEAVQRTLTADRAHR